MASNCQAYGRRNTFMRRKSRHGRCGVIVLSAMVNLLAHLQLSPASHSNQVSRSVFVQIKKLLRLQGRRIPDLQRRTSAVKVQILAISSDGEPERRTRFEFLLLDHLV